MHKITYIQLEKNPLSWQILHWRRGQRGWLISAVPFRGTMAGTPHLWPVWGLFQPQWPYVFGKIETWDFMTGLTHWAEYLGNSNIEYSQDLKLMSKRIFLFLRLLPNMLMGVLCSKISTYFLKYDIVHTYKFSII